MDPNDAHKVKTHKVEVNGKIADLDDSAVQDIVKSHGGHHSYTDHLATAQNAKDVHDHPATKALQKHGYVGASHWDYDPHDFEKDTKTTCIFNREHIKEKE